MGALHGLAAAADLAAPKRNTPSVKWFKVDDGKSVKFRIANEGGADSPHYNEERGTVLVVKEHAPRDLFPRSALCTKEDEGRCYGCEQHAKDYKAGWGAKVRCYTNVIVEPTTKGEEPYVAVWGFGAGPKSTTFQTILDYFTEYGSISANTWKIKRTGKDTETVYTLLPGPADTEPFDWSGVELFDLTLAVRDIPYADQEAFYHNVKQNALAADQKDTW